jgi:uncharacterized membrane protein
MAATGPLRTLGRMLLGGALIFAGTTHLTVARNAFRAQVPPWVPFEEDDVVVASGVVEIGLGSILIALPKEKKRIGILAAVFFTAIFPGNISQWLDQRSAFGLDTDRKRFVRLFFQPLLVLLALWSTGVFPKPKR